MLAPRIELPKRNTTLKMFISTMGNMIKIKITPIAYGMAISSLQSYKSSSTKSPAKILMPN